MNQIKPNKQVIVDALVEAISLGTSYSQALAQVCTKWHISKRTFDRYWKLANEQVVNKRALLEKVKLEVDTSKEIQERKLQLRTSIEKQLHLQKLIDDIEADIQRGIIEDYYVVNGIVKFVKKVMNAETKAQLRLVIQKLYSELNRMQGDYAPSKTMTATFNADKPTRIAKKYFEQVDELCRKQNEIESQ